MSTTPPSSPSSAGSPSSSESSHPPANPQVPAIGRSRFAPADDALPVAPLGRRLVALAIDWAAAVAISAGFFQYDAMVTLGIFALMTAVLVGTLGSTIGHLALGLGVRRGPGAPVGIPRAVLRTVLLCLVIPAVVWGPDRRGLHDVLAGTTIIRIR